MLDIIALLHHLCSKDFHISHKIQRKEEIENQISVQSILGLNMI